jgi:hypothetical protein
MKFKKLTLFLFCIVLLLNLPGMLPGQEKSKEKWEKFKNDFKSPGLKMIWDEKAGVPRRILGLKVSPALKPKKAMDEESVSEIALGFLANYEALFNIPEGAVKKRKIKKFKDKWYVNLQTFYNGIPILKGKVGFTMDEDGTILSYSSNYNPKVKLKTKPSISKEKALTIAHTHHKPGIDLPIITKEAYLTILADEYRLIWYIYFGTEAGHVEVDRVFYIDAMTGEKIRDFYPHPSAINGVVRGEVYHEHSTDTPVAEPFEHLNVSVPGYTASTNAQGNYTLSPGSGNYVLTMRLEGPFVRVRNWDATTQTPVDIEHTADVSDPGTHDFTWTAANSNPDDGDGVSVFWHANRLHDNYYQDIVGISWNNHWTGTPQMNYTVNRGTIDNAHAGNPIEIYSDLAARNCDVIYHETTHNVLNDIFGSYIGWPNATSEGYAFDEGFADYVACSFNNDSVYGEIVHPGNTRDCDNTLQYPGITYNWNGYDGAPLISGVVWDLWDKQGMNHNETDALHFEALYHMATLTAPYYFSNPNQSNYLTSLLTVDDDNNNLSDGTPHDRQIFQAFRNHDLLPVDAFCGDDASDDGNVPSQGTQGTSPDIWVRNNPDGGTVHQNPVYNRQCYIYVRVRNSGYLPANTVTVKVYRADPAGGLSWPYAWNFIGNTVVTNLAADSQTVTAPIPWTPTGTAAGNGCLLVRLECDQDIITEEGNVKEDNNIAQKNLGPAIMVTSPNAGENWELGTTKNITWNYGGFTGNVKLVLRRQDGTYVGLIADNIDVNARTFSWQVGTLLGGTAALGTDYIIRIRQKTGETVYDDSDVPFAILDVKLTSPNGGEKWKLGSTQNITWEAGGFSETVKLVLWENGNYVGLIKDNLDAASGFFSWQVGKLSIGTMAPVGTTYSIRIRQMGGITVYDDSDAPFTIGDIVVTTPAAGTKWEIGCSGTVTWNAQAVSNTVRLVLWQNGNYIGIIDTGIPAASGSYYWTVGQLDDGGTAPAGEEYVIKVSEEGGSYINGDSGAFTLVKQTNNLSLPGIIEAEDYDEGGEGISYHDTTPGNICNPPRYRFDDVDIQTCYDSGGGYNVGWIDAGEWLEYTVSVTRSGYYDIGIRAAASGGGAFSLHTVAGCGTLIPIINYREFLATGGPQVWETITVPRVFLSAGTKVFRFKAEIGNFNLNKITGYLSNQSPYGGITRSIPGTIQAEDYDVGGEWTAYHDTTAGNICYYSAYRFEDVDVENSPVSGPDTINVGYIDTGEWLEYTVEINQSGYYNISARVAPPTPPGGKFSLEIDGIPFGTVTFPDSGQGPQDYTTVTLSNVYLPRGKTILRINMLLPLWNFDYIQFIKR